MTKLTIKGINDGILIEVSRVLLEEEQRLNKRYIELGLKAKEAIANRDIDSLRVYSQEVEEVFDKFTKIAKFNSILWHSLRNEEES